MSIWEDLNEYPGSVSFYGFPAVATVENNKFRVGFPKGVGNIQEVAVNLSNLLGGKISDMGVNHVEVEIEDNCLASLIMNALTEMG